MILASTESAPTAETRSQSTPLPLMEPPTALSRAFFWTGSGSPEIIASSTVDSPATTTPSAGTMAPGSTFTTSLGINEPAGTSSRAPC